MQIFIKLLTGKTLTLDVDETDTIGKVESMIEEKENIAAPLQHLIFAGKGLNIERTLQEYKILKESTLHCTGRMCGEIYIRWQGSYLMRKDHPNCYQNFWHDLTKKNWIKTKIIVNGEDHSYFSNTCQNLTVYHLKKIVAKFLCLKTFDISLSLPNEPFIFFSNNFLIEKIDSRILLATLTPVDT